MAQNKQPWTEQVNWRNAAGTAKTRYAASLLLLLLLCGLRPESTANGQTRPNQAFTEKEVSFKTEDGWVIQGVLSLPRAIAAGEKVAGVVMVPSPSHDRDIYGHSGYPSVRATLEKDKIATLRIDIRGRGASSAPHDYSSLTEEQRSRVAYDVTAAIAFLSQLPMVDAARIGIVAEGRSAEAAVLAACSDSGVRAVVMLSGRMGQKAKDLVPGRQDLALLCVVSREDQTSFADMTDAYKLSRSTASTLMVQRDLGLGNAMFIMWAAKFPNEKPLDVTVGEWMIARLQPSLEAREVSFQSEDGWTLYGSLRKPHRSQGKAPGVVMVHSNLSDRFVFNEVEHLLADAGFVALNFDFRGRGKSRGKGSHFDLPQQERDNGYMDVRAALNFLGSQPDVDANRLIVVATSVGVRYGLKAANMDARVKSFVMLGGLPERTEVEKSTFPILFVSSLGIPQIAKAFKEFYDITRLKGSQLLEYEGGGVGYHLFEIDESLQPVIVKWLKAQFGPQPQQ